MGIRWRGVGCVWRPSESGRPNSLGVGKCRGRVCRRCSPWSRRLQVPRAENEGSIRLRLYGMDPPLPEWVLMDCDVSVALTGVALVASPLA